MTNANFFNFNDAGEQQSFDVIPANTVVPVQLNIKPGGGGLDGYLTRAHTEKGDSENLNCVAVVFEGEHAKRNIFIRFTVSGKNHAATIKRSRKTFRAILDSVHELNPKDESEAAKAKRQITSWDDFDQLRFQVRVGVEPPKNGYQAKNTIKHIITPDHKEYKKIEQVDRSNLPKPDTSAAAPAQPANMTARPQWAQPEKK